MKTGNINTGLFLQMRAFELACLGSNTDRYRSELQQYT